MSKDEKNLGLQSGRHSGAASGDKTLSRREALEKSLTKAAYLAPVAALLLTKQAKAGETVIAGSGASNSN